MNKNFKLIIFLILLFPTLCNAFSISPKEAKEIGMKIWKNECNGTIEGLIFWNENEPFFISLGIGHFIWYIENPKEKVFHETFPSLLKFLAKKGKKLPEGILKKGSTACPWNSRAEFMRNSASQAVKHLRKFLVDTIDLQVEFIVQRLNDAMNKIIKTLPKSKQALVKKQFQRMADTPGGFYALIDYVNFKGDGAATHEQYKGYRWGLLQVLESMKGTAPGRAALQEFVSAAQAVLTGRVEYAPQEAQEREARWLVGWKNRLNTYLKE